MDDYLFISLLLLLLLSVVAKVLFILYVTHDIPHITVAVCISQKIILSGNTDQVDLPGKVTEHKEMARKKGKV